MDPMNRMVMVIPRRDLFREGAFQGYAPAGGIDYEQRILKHHSYLLREVAEQDPSYKQPIGYALLVNPKRKKVFAYQRSTRDKDYPEKRLQGKWSWGLGGHIERGDDRGENPLRESLLREIAEEVGITDWGRIRPLGYINDDSDPVGKVHFGILFLVETGAVKPPRLSAELAEGAFRDPGELASLCSDPEAVVEKWSRLALNPLAECLKWDLP